MNKLEQDLEESIKLTEGLLSSLAKLFMKRKVKKQYKKVYDIAKDDPEIQAALMDLEDYHARLNRAMKNLCKRNPQHPKC